jgi:hypothetical protein
VSDPHIQDGRVGVRPDHLTILSLPLPMLRTSGRLCFRKPTKDSDSIDAFMFALLTIKQASSIRFRHCLLNGKIKSNANENIKHRNERANDENSFQKLPPLDAAGEQTVVYPLQCLGTRQISKRRFYCYATYANRHTCGEITMKVLI